MAYNLVHGRMFIYNFVNALGHTRPDSMVISSIESTSYGVAVRGTLGESSERATQLIGQYVDQLTKDPQFGRRFEITVSSFERDRTSDLQNFEIAFRFLPPPASP